MRGALLEHRVDVRHELFERAPDVAEVGHEARVLEGARAVGPVDEFRGVLARHAEHVADHHRGHVDADVLDEVEVAVGVRGERAVKDEVDDFAHPLGVLERALRRERALHERLQAVVARRVLRDQHALDEIHRVGRLVIPGEFVDDDDAAFGGEGRVVAADRRDVREAHDRPEAALLGERVKRAPVQSVHRPHLCEQLMRGAVLPQVEVAQVELREV